jgi:TolB-like protein
MQEGPVSFGPFVLDAARGGLRREGTPVVLGQRALAVLAALAEAPGQTVSKADLLARAWPGVIVEEGNLTVQIAALRKALGPAHDGSDWIITVPRVGYRLVAASSAAAAGVITPAIPSLAVLPFVNLGSDPDHDWFADGVVDDIITALSRFRSFAVVARSSSFAYKGRAVDARQVARELGVRYVLEGTVRRAGDRLRIGAELVEATTGANLWAQRFDGAVDDIFDFQDRITEDVALLVAPQIEAAEIERSRRERPGSIAAYDAYLQAMTKINKQTARENAEAYALLVEALEHDPHNALLLAHAGWALGHRNAMGWPPIGPDDVACCADYARRGLQRAAGDPTVMAHCGLNLLQTAKEYDWGMAVLESAVRVNPNNLTVVFAAGIAHLHCGAIEDALACFHRALRLGPRNPEAYVSLTGIAHAHLILGDYHEAITWALRSRALNATFDCTYWMLVAANAHLGRMEEASRQLAELRMLAPEVTVASIRAGQCAKDPRRIEPILEGLRLAGLPED